MSLSKLSIETRLKNIEARLKKNRSLFANSAYNDGIASKLSFFNKKGRPTAGPPPHMSTILSTNKGIQSHTQTCDIFGICDGRLLQRFVPVNKKG